MVDGVEWDEGWGRGEGGAVAWGMSLGLGVS